MLKPCGLGAGLGTVSLGTLAHRSLDMQALDTLTPLGRGQAQLLLGPAASGKTSLAVDAIIGQHALQRPGQSPVRCVYASVGHRYTHLRYTSCK